MPRYRVVPYKAGSRSATALSRALGGSCVKVDGTSRFNPRLDDVVINWGRSARDGTALNFWGGTLNNGANLERASNKLLFFEAMVEAGYAASIPPFWRNSDEIPAEAFPIVCRTTLTGHSGAGIVISNDRGELVRAPLYVQYLKKKDEYRIHVGRNRDGDTSIISIQRKAKREGYDNPNWQVRNHQNGFVYVRGGVNPPQCVIELARQALRVSGLDFGAVDVIYNERNDRAYVLEINTAPGLEGQTVTDYANFFTGRV